MFLFLFEFCLIKCLLYKNILQQMWSTELRSWIVKWGILFSIFITLEWGFCCKCPLSVLLVLFSWNPSCPINLFRLSVNMWDLKRIVDIWMFSWYFLFSIAKFLDNWFSYSSGEFLRNLSDIIFLGRRENSAAWCC